ncbi:MAG: L-fucose/L-arabinose isomerase family protein [Spirochaetales bacterium]|nr:L-fucose/L-arabinose isomerase family protein [Spirochaetales bacterium]MCF7939364.1 L-fucose/L-arabinose isomerase family protein [Spirochaetales bacterium]
MTTVGLIIGNRGFFPTSLCEDGRERMLKVLEKEGYRVIVLSADDSPYGSVETYDQARASAELFKRHREEIEGIIVTLPNFGDERAVADTIRLSELEVPVLMHAFPDNPGKLEQKYRRDSFCGKLSACNNLYQYGIPFTLTDRHTVEPESDDFRSDLRRFSAICRVVNGLKKARFGQVGARPAAFITVRYSEKILERAGMSVDSVDLSEIFGRARELEDKDPAVSRKIEDIRGYIASDSAPAESLMRMAKLGVVLDRYIDSNSLNGTAIQCWSAMEEYYGVVPCTLMSMLSNSLTPSACETDITGLIGMYAMVLASGQPSALLDWNNNFGDDPDKGIVFHCSNLPKAFFADPPAMESHPILSGDFGKENSVGTLSGTIRKGPITYCRVSTDDYNGRIKVYLGEGEITDDQVSTFGGYGVVNIPNFQGLLTYMAKNGFEHHVAINPLPVARVLEEAFTNYLDWDVYHHTE